MEIPEDDVGIELMNATFRDMGILVMTPEGYRLAPEFVRRMEQALERRAPGAPVAGAEYRQALVDELQGMGVPSGFERIIANWVVHEVRRREWEEA